MPILANSSALIGKLVIERKGKKRQAIVEVPVVRGPDNIFRIVQSPRAGRSIHSKEVHVDFLKKLSKEDLLGQPIVVLQIARTTVARLLAMSIKTIGDLAAKSEAELLKFALPDEQGKGRAKFFSYAHLNDVLKQLSVFGLSLASSPEFTMGGLDKNRLVIEVLYSGYASESAARRILGEIDYELFRAYREASDIEQKVRLRNQLAERHFGLVEMFVRPYRYNQNLLRKDPAIEAEDLWSEGAVGVLRAVAGFDYTRGFKFSSYASYAIKSFIRRLVDNTSILPVHVIANVGKLFRRVKELRESLGRDPSMEEVAAALKMPAEEVFFLYECANMYHHMRSLDENLPGKGHDENDRRLIDTVWFDGQDARVVKKGEIVQSAQDRLLPQEDQLARKELAEAIGSMLKNARFLNDAERYVIRMYFGLEGLRDHTLEEIALQVDLTRSRIQQILDSGLGKLRTKKIWLTVREFFSDLPPPADSGNTEDSASDAQNMNTEEGGGVIT